MKIALCICTRNRASELHTALASVAHSTCSPNQVLVSDDSDLKQASKTAAVCSNSTFITYLQGPQRGLSANRNNCLNHLAPDIDAVSFIDDDVVLKPDFLALASSELIQRGTQTIITGGECKSGNIVTPHNCSFWGHQEVPPRDEDDYHGIVINATLFPRSLFTQARFDEALRYGSEEADICAQAEALGYVIRFCPKLINDHYPSPVNRTEYARVVEASRLYSTYKRYRLLQRDRRKAIMYAALAPLHIVGSALKSGNFQELRAAISAVQTATQYAWAAKHNKGLLR